MMWKIKPEFIDLWGSEADENTRITESDLDALSRAWEKPKFELLSQLIPISQAEAVAEMKEKISRTEKMARRGLLTAREAELRITRLIDDTLVEDAFTSREAWAKLEEEKRLADRRKWRFLLSLTKEKVSE